jgi:hypothetical protein
MSTKVSGPLEVRSTAKLAGMWAAWKAARAEQRDIAERRAIAKAWNDRYCYRVLFDEKAERLTGTAMCGLLPRGGNRWMCPDCNRIHAPTECSVWSGLQYPACCTTGAGNRLSHGVRVS